MPCDDKNPLVREGTSSLNRVLAALSTGYARVDERDDADLLLFAKRYASYLNYYDESNTVDGDWEALMKMDVSVILATLYKIDLHAVSGYKKLVYKKIKLSSSDADAKKEFKFLFDILFSLISLIDDQYNLLDDEIEYKHIIKNIIQNKLQLPLANLEKCFNDFKTASLLDYSSNELDGEAPLHVASDEFFSRNNLSIEWRTVVADILITLPALPDAKSLIVYIANHNLFNSQIELLLNGIAGLIKNAGLLFDQTLKDFPKHTPHYALFLSFVKLFRFAQDHLNEYTQRHLDFYYKDTLQLKNKSPEPDSAHLTFELQKPVKQDLLKKGSLFKGGKDITGKEISYSLTDDLVINKAAISKIQSWSKIIKNNNTYLIASPVANSGDGSGGKITSADNSWFTFGDRKKAINAKSGFAIASNLFFLNEGRRNITVNVIFADDISDINKSAFNTGCFTAELTGNKEWHRTNKVTISFLSNNQMEFGLELSPDDPPIVPYSEKIHKEHLEIDLPLLKISLNQNEDNSIPYYTLCTKQIVSAEIRINANELKDLMLSNDSGTVDASKPFKPFGNFPASGASFYIGSKEIFQKPLADFTLNAVWQNPPPTLHTKVNYLRQSNWNDSFDMENDIIEFSAPNLFKKSAIDFGPNEPLKATTLEGFVQIQLNDTQYSLETHLVNISNALSLTSITKDTASTTPKYNISIQPAPVPVDLVLTSFSVSYSAVETIHFSLNDKRDNNNFYHFTPFGYYEVHPALFGEGITAAEISERLTLIPNVINDGELFLGIENAEPDSVITILFQVADGSSNPLKDMEELIWYYLAEDNNWEMLNKHQIIDNSRNFTQSGIIIITMPPDISNKNTMLEKGLRWIKTSVAHNTDAVCKMILIQAQAGRAELVQDLEDQIEFRQVLPSKSISKLVLSDSTIKTIAQPFDSFNGRTRESDKHFYLRVSERLRHKQRGASIWDYEYIILEKFQKIYKVKCLNHSGFYPGTDGEVFCENFPGHVTLITIPDLKNKANINPLKPYTPIGLLTNISDYLKTVISPFVKLHVKNPQFEEIRLSFKVKFYDHLDVSMYQQMLNIEIEKFLCPWAWEDVAEISFGGKIIKSVLLNFVEERSYVDYVTCFTMDHIIEREGNLIKKVITDVEEAVASTSRSVMVSYYNEEETDETKKRHLIDTNITC
jgi:hypothetical protein